MAGEIESSENRSFQNQETLKTDQARTIFIGDIHGCLIELKQLIAKLQLDKKDRIILLGDLVNKGPYSLETIRYVYHRKFQSVMGNNDYFFLRCKQDYLMENLTTEEYDWYAQLPFYIKEEHFIAVHGGLHPDLSLESTPKKILLTLRYIDGHPWYQRYHGALPVIYGHWAQKGINIQPNPINPMTIGLDSGCVYGKVLSAYIFETKELVQIPSQKVYQAIN